MSLYYRSASDFYREMFGTKTYKLSLDAGTTCPNRDGTLGTTGCIFCSAGGSGEFAADRNKSIPQQVEEARLLVEKKAFGRKGKCCDNKPVFIAYFQNFTATYGSQTQLIEKYRNALLQPDVKGLALATRPDCLTTQMLDFLADLSRTTFVQLEFGLQTASDITAEKINRCYPTSTYNETLRLVKQKAPHIHVVTHIIFGLPGETEGQMLETVRHAVNAGTDGMKITVLYVLKNTVLAKMHEEKQFECLTKDQYFHMIGKALEIIPPEIVIHRLTGDGPKSLLTAPLWTGNKRQVRNELENYLKKQGIFQGKGMNQPNSL